MGRISTKKDKSMFQLLREDLGLSREKAADLLESIPPERIERIESGKSPAQPDEVMIMAEKYRAPDLCNYYCSQECPIGRAYVPGIEIKDFSRLTLEMLATTNRLSKQKDRMIEIASDGRVNDDEIEDFVHIQNQLEKMSMMIESLQLWSEKMLAEGKINREIYAKYKKAGK